MDKRPRSKTRKPPAKKAKALVFRTQFDPNYKGDDGVHKYGASMTIPNDHLTVREMLINHSRGHNLPIKTYEGEYFEDAEIPVFDDMLDEIEYRKELEHRRQRTEQIIKEEADKAKKEAEANREPHSDETDTDDPLPPKKSKTPVEPPKKDS